MKQGQKSMQKLALPQIKRQVVFHVETYQVNFDVKVGEAFFGTLKVQIVVTFAFKPGKIENNLTRKSH